MCIYIIAVYNHRNFVIFNFHKILAIQVISYPNQKHPWCKKSCGQELEKGLDEKEVKSKMGGQGLCSGTTDQNKILTRYTHGVNASCTCDEQLLVAE